MLTITAESHVDHVDPLHLDWIRERFADREGFFIETVEVPEALPPLSCELVGPLAGSAPVPESEVCYRVRPGRGGPSRLVRRLPSLTRTLTVVAGPAGEAPCVLYTAYGGGAAPREPWDPSLDDAGRAESTRFWSEHALCAKRSVNGQEIDAW